MTYNLDFNFSNIVIIGKTLNIIDFGFCKNDWNNES